MDLVNPLDPLTQELDDLGILNDRSNSADLQGLHAAPPGPIQDFLRAQLEERIAEERERQTIDVFPLAPSEHMSKGEIELGQQNDGSRVALFLDGFRYNVVLLGGTGGGKSTLGTQIGEQAMEYCNVLWEDPKHDGLGSAARNKRCLIITEDFPYAPFDKPAHLTLAQHITQVRDNLAACAWGGLYFTLAFERGLTATLQEHPRPSIKQVHDTLQRIAKDRSLPPQLRTEFEHTAERLRMFETYFPGVYHTTGENSIPRDELYHHSVLLPSNQTMADSFLYLDLLQHVFAYNREHKIRTLTHLAIMDEAAGRYSKQNITANPFISLQGRCREFGLGMVILTNAAADSDPRLRAHAHTKIAFKVASPDEGLVIARELGLNTRQARYYLNTLDVGQAIARRNDGYRQPFLINIPAPIAPKDPTPAQWRAALDRARQLAPTPAIPPPIPTSSNVTPPADAPRVDAARDERIALNKNESIVMAYLGEHGVALVSDIFEDTGLHRVVVDRILQRTHDVFGFTASERVSTGIGNGKHGDATYLTTAGHSWLGTKPHLMRGNSSVEHYYWCSTIARHLGGHLETMVGAKSCDIIIKYDPGKHARFLQYVLDHGQRLTDNTNNPTPGSIVAIECECHPEKTALANAIRNNDLAHIPLTIIAVTGDPRDTIALLKAGLDVNHWQTIHVVPVLMLVDLAREPRREPRREKARRKKARRTPHA